MKSNTSSQLRLIIKASSSSIESCRSPPFSYQALAASRLESLRRFQRTRNTLWTFPSKDIPADYFPFSLQGIAFTILVLFGKFCAAGAFTILHIATAELYPTAIRFFFHQIEVQMSTVGILKKSSILCRNSMLGVCSTIARVGGISAPWIAVYLPTQVEL